MHTKDKLAAALAAAGLDEMAADAASGYYHDFLSPLAFPATQLIADLRRVNSPAAFTLMNRIRAGEFDASDEEVEAFGNSPEGRKGLARLKDAWVEIAKQKRPPDL